jgi:hypothetical protein
MFPYMPFFMNLFPFFFQNSLCRFCFVVFFFKILWIVTMFPHMVFVLLQCFPTCFFPKIIFVEFFFNIEFVENSALIFPTCFFSIFFHFCFLLFIPKLFSFFFNFLSFFCRIVFVDFIFLIWS